MFAHKLLCAASKGSWFAKKEGIEMKIVLVAIQPWPVQLQKSLAVGKTDVSKRDRLCCPMATWKTLLVEG